MGQVGCADPDDPARECVSVFWVRLQELREVCDVGGQLGYFVAGSGEPGQEAMMFALEVVWFGEQHSSESARRNVAAVDVCTALVDVFVQEVQAAREAESLDFFEEVQDGDGRVFGPAFTQVLAIRVDEAGSVFGDAEHALGLIGSGVAFDGVQGQLQTAGALEQAYARLEQVMDLVPALQGGLCAGTVVKWGV